MIIKRANHQDNAQFQNTELKQRLYKAGIKGEQDAAYHIDFTLEKSTNWAVIHNLSLKHHGRKAQIDHILINRFLEIYVLETKHSCVSLHINEKGEFSRCDESLKPVKAMKSPIEQNREHILILQDAINSLDMPKRLGVRLKPSYHSYILIASDEIIQRPKSFDTSNIVKTDAFITAMYKKLDADINVLTMAKIVSSNTLKSIAEKVVALHQLN